MFRLKRIAAGVATAFALAHGGSAAAALSTPSAIAESLLQVSKFAITSGGSPLAAKILSGDITIEANPVSNGSASASLNGSGPPTQSNPVNNPLGTAFNVQNSVGAGTIVNSGAGNFGFANTNFTPGLTTSASPLVAQYVAGASTSVGNATTATDLVNVQSIVSLTTAPATGNTSSEQTLVTKFTINTSVPIDIDLSFDALGYFRTGLGQPQLVATAGYTWNANVKSVGTNAGLTNNQDLWNWSPNGHVGFGLNGACFFGGGLVAAGTCAELASAFNMANDSQTTQAQTDNVTTKSGHFDSKLTVPVGTWQFTINHTTLAKATIESVPEPGTLALLGLGLIGIGARRRRSKAA